MPSQYSASLLVFAGASLALVTASAIAVIVGHGISQTLAGLPLKLIAGLGFIAIGLWLLYEHFS